MERRKTLANQSQTCQLLKRSLYVASFLAIFFFFFFLKIPVSCIFPGHFHSFFCYILVQYPCTLDFSSHLHFHSVALLSIFPEFWKWSGVPIPFCIVLLPHLLSLYRPFITPITGWLQLYTETICMNQFFWALSANSFCDCKYLSTTACASEDTLQHKSANTYVARSIVYKTIQKYQGLMKSAWL